MSCLRSGGSGSKPVPKGVPIELATHLRCGRTPRSHRGRALRDVSAGRVPIESSARTGIRGSQMASKGGAGRALPTPSGILFRWYRDPQAGGSCNSAPSTAFCASPSAPRWPLPWREPKSCRGSASVKRQAPQLQGSGCHVRSTGGAAG